MKTRKIILLSSIAVLAAVYAVQLAFSRPDKVRVLTVADKIDSITITRNDAPSVTLRKEGEGWVIGDKKYPADQALVDDMLAPLNSLKVLGSVSKNVADERYGLADGAGIGVEAASGGKTVRKLIVGKDSSTSRQAYTQVDGKAEVLLVSGSLHDTFGKSADEYRSRAVWAFGADTVTKVSSTAGAAYTLEKAGNPAAWSVTWPSGASLDAEKAQSWVSGLASVTAQSWADPAVLTGGKPLASVSLVAGGKEYSLTVQLKDGESRYLCTASSTPYPFYLSSYVAEKFLKTVQDLAK
jgi:hypothetical protein